MYGVVLCYQLRVLLTDSFIVSSLFAVWPTVFYIALADLIPQLKKNTLAKTIKQFFWLFVDSLWVLVLFFAH